MSTELSSLSVEEEEEEISEYRESIPTILGVFEQEEDEPATGKDRYVRHWLFFCHIVDIKRIKDAMKYKYLKVERVCLSACLAPPCLDV